MKKFLNFLGVLAVFASASVAFAQENLSEIRVSDGPVGFASYVGEKNLAGGKNFVPSAKGANGGEGAQDVFVVSTRNELAAALTKGSRRIIYVKGMIDMSDSGKGSLIPSTVSGSTKELDKTIAQLTKDSCLPCNSYSEWKTKYTASFDYDEDQYGDVAALRTKLNEFWRELTFIRLQDNTTLIGLDENSGIMGGSLSIKGKSNIVVRNLTIKNCYNPFPKVEARDGLNADFDCISIQNSTYVWVDHCSVYSVFSHDEIESDKYATKDGTKVKWQVYDGLCDITNTNDFVTISWCKFSNHDKTMLIGNSDKKVEDRNHQTITLHHNNFDNCTQRLPMVRFATIHIFNNVYTNVQSKGIDRRNECKVYSQGNWFSSVDKSVTSNTYGSFYDEGSVNIKKANLSKTPEWNPSDYYSYTAESGEQAKASVAKYAGAGKLKVIR